MKRIVTVILLVVLATACSETETLHKKDGVCYDRNAYRVFGLKYDSNQSATDRLECQ